MDNKKYKVLTAVLLVVILILVGFEVFSRTHDSRNTAEQPNSTKEETEQLQSTISDLEAQLKAKSDDLEKCEALLAQANEERQAQADAYDNWYNSLSDEVKKIVDEREATNKMVNDLLANNSEYAEYYIKITEYSQKESRTIEESKDVIAINEKMRAIESDWQKSHNE